MLAMVLANTQRAEILTQALPYMKKYNNKIVVIKYGGNAMIDDALTGQVMKDIVLLHQVGVKVVLVHGGGPDINDTLEKMNIKSSFSGGLRVTDKATVEVVQMVLAGKTNKNLVNMIQKNGGSAVGLSGIDGGMIKAEKKDDRLGFVGEIVMVNPDLILHSLENSYIPVISTVGYDDDGNVYNINADTAAARIASSLNAESFILLTDVKGIYKDIKDESSFIPEITSIGLSELIEQGCVSEGMIPKAECCINAISAGVKKVFIIDGTLPHAIIIEMFTEEGVGTLIL
jgi:acetylglutamate kinase